MNYLGRVVLMAFAISLAAVQAAKGADVVRLSVAVSLRDSLFNGISEGFQKESGIKIEYLDNEKFRSMYPSLSIVSFKDVIEGKADAAIASTEYEDWEKLVKKNKIDVPPGITKRVVGRDLISIVVNKSTNVKELSESQLTGIFTGTIKNWKEVGGADLPIKILHSADKPAIRVTISKIVMGGKEFGGTQEELATIQDVRKKLASAPGVIAYDTEPALSADVTLVKTQPIGRPATMITKGRPTPEVEKLIAYIRKSVKQ